MRYLILLILLTGCVTQKRCLEKFPPVVGSDTVVTEHTVYRDTIIYRHLPGDTVFVDVPVYIDNGQPMTVEPARAETELAMAQSWVERGRLMLELQQKDSILQFKLDSAFRSNKQVEYITKTETHQLPPKPFLKWWFSISLVFIVLILVIFVKSLFKS